MYFKRSPGSLPTLLRKDESMSENVTNIRLSATTREREREIEEYGGIVHETVHRGGFRRSSQPC